MAKKTKYYIGGAVALTLMIVLSMSLINVKNAYHLDENYTNLGKVTSLVKSQNGQGIIIPNGHYLRIQFEKKLTSSNDILIYAQAAKYSNYPNLEVVNISVYKKGGKTKIAEFQNISQEGFYEVLLKYMTGASIDTFDLKSEGDVYYDYVTDPIIFGSLEYGGCSPGNITTTNSTVDIDCNLTVEENGFYSANLTFDNFDTQIYGPGLLFLVNLDNRSELGENNTRVADISNIGANGTIVNGAVCNYTYGEYNGGCNFDGVNDYIIFPFRSEYNLSKTNQFTEGFWVYYNNYKPSSYSMIFGREEGYRTGGIILDTNNITSLNVLNGTYDGISLDDSYRKSVSFDNPLPLGNYYFVVATYSNTTGYLKLYLNGELNKTSSAYVGMSIYDDFGNLTISSSLSAPIRMDQVFFMNRTMSDSEIKGLYKKFITKYNSTFWGVHSTQILNYSSKRLNSTSQIYVNYYNLSIVNSTGVIFSTSTNKINQSISNTTIISNFSTLIGNLSEDKFGFNIHSISYFTTDNQSTWYKEKWNYLEGEKYGRIDQGLEYFFSGPYNFDIEAFKVNGPVSYNNGTTHEIAFGFGVSWQSANGSAGRTNDSHTGNYSLFVNSTKGNLYIDKGEGNHDLLIEDGKNYNISFWVKGVGGNANISAGLQRQEGSYPECGGIGWTEISTSWTQMSFICNAPSNPNMTFYRFVLNVHEGTNITFDDFNITDNATGGYPEYWVTNNSTIATWKTKIDWLISTGSSAEIITSYMPLAGANLTSAGCNLSSSKSYKTCPAKNPDIIGRMNRDWFNYITENWTRYDQEDFMDECWNEPEIFLMELYGSNNEVKVDEYIKICNATFFYMNKTSPKVRLIAPAIAGDGCKNPESYLMLNSSLKNFSIYNQFDIGVHCYQSPVINYLEAGTAKVKQLCTELNVTCNGIWWDEFNLGYGDNGNDANNIKNTTSRFNEWEVNIVSSVIRLWRVYPSFAHVGIYQWTDGCNYGVGCEEYPMRWSSVSSPDYENTTYPPYWVVYNLSKICPDGTNILDTLSNNENITTLGCKNGSQYGIIASNEVDKSQRLIINLSNLNGSRTYPNSNIKNYKSLQIYNISNGIIDAGIIDGFNVFYLVSDSVNISLGSGISTIKFTPVNKTQQNLWATGQTISKGLFNITNTGIVAMNFSMKVNSTKSGWSMECNNATSEPWIVLNDSYRNIYTNLLPGGNFQVWCRTDLSNPTSSWSGKVYFQY